MKLPGFGFLICLYFFASSCSAGGISGIAGTYRWISRPRISSAELNLKKDNTFSYRFQAGDLSDDSIKGTWVAEDRHHLLLTSEIATENDVAIVTEKRDTTLSAGTVRVQFIDVDGKNSGGSGRLIQTDESLQPIAFESAFYEKPYVLVKSGSLRSISYSARLSRFVSFYPVRDTAANDFTIRFRIDTLRGYLFFNKRRWRVYRKKIVEIEEMDGKLIKRKYLRG